ncbi:MAG: crossover junction endodeoxyribonuclease RuvC [Candidatus Omnitrophica bacterium]|nr:crossover junction endodeoxyribonuclease RuvC [Candidatus Omnitrophota bacterium]
MRILGVDPGSRVTGYGIIDSDGLKINLLEAGEIKPKATETLSNRICKIYENLSDIVTTYKPDVLILEKLYTHHQRLTTASVLGHVRGVICLLCAQKKIVLKESSVKRIRKALTGNGSATKRQTQSMVASFLNVDEARLTPDASDALALALGYITLNRIKI